MDSNPWIPIGGRLPAYDQWVEVTGESESLMGRKFLAIAHLDRATDNWLGVDFGFLSDLGWTPTHWRTMGVLP